MFKRIKNWFGNGHLYVGKIRVDYAFIVFLTLYSLLSILVYGGYV